MRRQIRSAMLMSALMIAACDPASPPPTPAKQASETSDEERVEVVQQTEEEVVVAGIPVWPQPREDDEEVVLSDDKYAVNVILAIDTSGSMDGACIDGGTKIENKFSAAINAAREFVSTVPPGANIGIVSFGGEQARVISDLTSDRAETEAGIASLRSGGGTPMAHAVEYANHLLSEQAHAQGGGGQYRLVVLGDGDPADAVKTANWLDYTVWHTNILINTIGFCADLRVLERPGMVYKNVNNAQELRNAFASVLAEVDLGDGSIDVEW